VIAPSWGWSDDDVLGPQASEREPVGSERAYVNRWLAMQVEVAKDLADGRALEEPVTGET